MILYPILAAATTFVLTAWVRRYALKRALLDRPTHRSMHESPTPRGGGIAIVVSVLAYALFGLITGVIDRRLGIALVGGGTIIAAVGLVDDVTSLSAGTRMIAHVVASIWSVWWLGGLPILDVGFAQLTLGLAGGVAAVGLLVWVINLYNFMDGIDGLASIEAVFLAGSGGLLLSARNATSLAGVSYVVLGAAVGFLCWNWAPAKIFMGDVGSGFLGFTFGTLAIASENSGALPLIVWMILGSAFFMDASITLARRIRGGVWRHAHRTHAYQRAVISGLSHSQVALSVSGFNLLLGGLAAVAVVKPSILLGAAAVSVALAVILYILVGRMQPFVLERPPHSGGPNDA